MKIIFFSFIAKEKQKAEHIRTDPLPTQPPFSQRLEASAVFGQPFYSQVWLRLHHQFAYN